MSKSSGAVDDLLGDRPIDDAAERLQHLDHGVVRLGGEARLDRRDVRGRHLVEAAPREHGQEVVPQLHVVVHQRVDPETIGLAQVEEPRRELVEARRRRLVGRGLGGEELGEELLLEGLGPAFGVGLACDRSLDPLAYGSALGPVDDDVDLELILRSLPRAQLDHD